MQYQEGYKNGHYRYPNATSHQELTGDFYGNDNGLCEQYDDCIFTIDLGSYQGHGSLLYYTDLLLNGGNTYLYIYSYQGY